MPDPQQMFADFVLLWAVIDPIGTQNDLHTFEDQLITAVMTLAVVAIAYALMRSAGPIARTIGSGGASIISRVMGMILASVAATEVLEGIREYFG